MDAQRTVCLLAVLIEFSLESSLTQVKTDDAEGSPAGRSAHSLHRLGTLPPVVDTPHHLHGLCTRCI